MSRHWISTANGILFEGGMIEQGLYVCLAAQPVHRILLLQDALYTGQIRIKIIAVHDLVYTPWC